MNLSTGRQCHAPGLLASQAGRSDAGQGPPTPTSIDRARSALAATVSRARFVARLDRGQAVYISSTLEDVAFGMLDDRPTEPMALPMDSEFAAEQVVPVRAAPRPVAPAVPQEAAPQPRRDQLWGSSRPEGNALGLALRKLIQVHGKPMALRTVWNPAARSEAVVAVLELHAALVPLIARMRLDFRTAHDQRGDSADERDFVTLTVAAYLKPCLAPLPLNELKRLRSRLESKRGPWAKAQSMMHRGLVDAALKAARSGREGEIAVHRQLQRRAALDAIARAFRQALRDEP